MDSIFLVRPFQLRISYRSMIPFASWHLHKYLLVVALLEWFLSSGVVSRTTLILSWFLFEWRCIVSRWILSGPCTPANLSYQEFFVLQSADRGVSRYTWYNLHSLLCGEAGFNAKCILSELCLQSVLSTRAASPYITSWRILLRFSKPSDLWLINTNLLSGMFTLRYYTNLTYP